MVIYKVKQSFYFQHFKKWYFLSVIELPSSELGENHVNASLWHYRRLGYLGSTGASQRTCCKSQEKFKETIYSNNLLTKCVDWPPSDLGLRLHSLHSELHEHHTHFILILHHPRTPHTLHTPSSHSGLHTHTPHLTNTTHTLHLHTPHSILTLGYPGLYIRMHIFFVQELDLGILFFWCWASDRINHIFALNFAWTPLSSFFCLTLIIVCIC